MQTTLKQESLYDKELDKKYVIKLLKREEIDKMSFLANTMFMAMFQNESRKKYSCKLFSLLFGIDYDYLLENLKLSKNETGKKLEYSKGERCDFVASINGLITNIEVNNNSSKETLERNIEYLTRIYSEKIRVGKKYKYALSIQININNFAFKGKDKTIETYYLMNKEGEILTEKLQFIQIYVPNIVKKCYTKGIESLNELERYILIMAEQNIEKARLVAKEDKFMNEYINEAIDVSRFAYLGEAYDKEEALKEEAFRDGVSEGISQGIEQGENRRSIEIVKKMLEEHADINFISRVTNLTVDEINDLK